MHTHMFLETKPSFLGEKKKKLVLLVKKKKKIKTERYPWKHSQM